MSRDIWRVGITGAAAAGVLFAVVLAVHARSLSGLLASWDLLLATALTTGIGAGVAYAWAQERYRRALRQLGSELAHFRDMPSSHIMVRRPGDPAEELADLLGPVEALCLAYRQIVADQVTKIEALDSLRLLVGQMDTERNQKLAVRTSGSSRNMVARLTPNFFWMTATPALQAFVNQRMPALNGRPFAEVVDAADLPHVEKALGEALESGEAHNIVFRMHPRAKKKAAGPPPERHVNMDAATTYAEDGKPLHLRCFFVDISDRVRAEQEVRRRTDELSQANERLRRTSQDLEAEQLKLERLMESYRDLYHNAPVMYFSLNSQGRFVTFNETLLRALGYTREDLARQPYTRLLPPEERRQWEEDGPAEDVASANALTREGEVETRWQKKDGTIIGVWIRTIPIQDENGRFVRSRSAAQDVTEHNRLANELRTRRDELEHANAELRVINKELEEFTSVVSHDLKEPLRTLQAFSSFLAEDFSGQLGPDGFQYINHLVQASKRLGKLIDDLLTLSRAGRITPDVESFNLIEIVATVRRDLADMVQRKEADLLVESSLPDVVGDPQRITQLLSNLVGNGLKYNTNPKPQVIIGAAKDVYEPSDGGRQHAAARNKDYVTVYVKDNGIGIDSRYHQQIFGIFRRLHKPEEYEGTGAGLAICKKIVEAHTGRIWVESTPGQGSTFYFTLPRAVVEMPETRAAEELTETGVERVSAHPAKNGAPSGMNPAVTSSRHIVLVEDMAEMGLIAQKLAHRAGHEITWFRTGEEAWNYLQEVCPDLLLVDIHLPGMDGVELCRRVRTLDHLHEMPIALFTQGQDGDTWCREAGGDFFLSKDLLCKPDVWLSRLQEILKGVAAGSAAG